SFSSLGPTPCTPYEPNNIKPEISAPGVDVYSAEPGGGYQNLSGTSMAGPHVAGVVALMREACPDCDPQTIKEAIIATAIRDGYVTAPATENNTFGNGFIDAYAAVVAVSNLGRVAGVVTDASSSPLAGVKVANASGSQFAYTNASGQYYLPLPEGTYTVEFSKFGYSTQAQGGVSITEGDTTFVNKTLATAPQGAVSGIVTSCFGGPMASATVDVLDTPVAPATTNGSGYYEITLPQGTYNLRASGTGCGSQTVNGVVVGASATQNFTLPSDPIYSCSAPDGGGYIACEDGDVSSPTYSWVEISPNASGPGTLTGITGDDSYGSFSLPFGFILYGVTYNTVYVSSNGYLSFGSGNSIYSNASLPNSSVGPAVFPLWDDLYPGAGGDISYYYSAAENAFIVEWREIQHYPSGNPETFQVWLIHDLGPNGSSRIRIQYQTLSNGSSCTVGVQDGSIANQYVYDGALDVNAQGLTSGRVITYGGNGCEGAADISVAPLAVTGQAPVGGNDSEILQICNAGACPLMWSISFAQNTPVLAMTAAGPGTVVDVSKADAAQLERVLRGDKSVEDPQRGSHPLDASGGPDTFGYTWKDSNEPSGPVFDWMDISTIGTNVGITGDDQTVSLTLPWTFRFYGADYTQINASSNGNLHFGTASTAYTNQMIPTSDAPNALLAPFWDDLYPSTSGTVYSYHDAANNRVIVQFHEMARISESTSRLTFQAILYQNGRIVFQYLTLTGTVTSCTVGIEDAAGTVGLPVVYNAAYLADNLAIEFSTTPQWLTFGGSASGVLESGQCADVTLLFDAGDLTAGTYDGELTVLSNDPDENPMTVPVEFHVGQLGEPAGLTIFYDPASGNLVFRWEVVAGA
ncbi:MAG: carboxypeptidase regulatory-like domain-containing protein, partial [bacterium]|nr:carboxypeptidase regulatory-like domain-containing protein [bacterium]